MNTLPLHTKTSTVLSVDPNAEGFEVWVKHDDGCEAVYTVNNRAFRAREGHNITAVLFGAHPVAIRNDSTQMKAQLLTGEDIEGSAPLVQSRPGVFWFAWVILIAFICPFAISLIQAFTQYMLGSSTPVQWLCEIIAGIFYTGAILGIPYWCIVHPRVIRFKHNRRIKAADRDIAQAYSKL